MSELSDQDLRSRFEVLRAGDEHDAPGFRAILDRAGPVPTVAAMRARRRPLRAVLSIAAVVLLAAGLVRVSRRHAFVAPPLSTWTSPTESLLHASGSELLVSPTLVPSMLAKLTSPPSQPLRGK
jgi:hypothetical protein